MASKEIDAKSLPIATALTMPHAPKIQPPALNLAFVLPDFKARSVKNVPPMKFVSTRANALLINMGISDAIVHQDFMDLYANIAYAIHLDLAKMGALALLLKGGRSANVLLITKDLIAVLMFVMIIAYMEDLQQVKFKHLQFFGDFQTHETIYPETFIILIFFLLMYYFAVSR